MEYEVPLSDYVSESVRERSSQTEPAGPKFWRQERRKGELHIHLYIFSQAFAKAMTGEEAEPKAKVWSSQRGIVLGRHRALQELDLRGKK